MKNTPRQENTSRKPPNPSSASSIPERSSSWKKNDLFALDLRRRVLSSVTDLSLIEEGDTVLCGVSGGADSVCLLLVLHALSGQLPMKLKVIHVHHGIRGVSAYEDADFVRRLSKRLGIPFKLCHVDVPSYASDNSLSTEDAARILRYRCFEEEALSLDGNIKIAVAHNMDDQAETLLMHLFRGSGLKGLSGMKSMNRRGNLTVIRPLLSVSRSDIERYLSILGQDYRTDETNLDSSYTRNFIRNDLMPLIKERFGLNTPSRIAGTAGLIQELSSDMQELSESESSRRITLRGGRVMLDIGGFTELASFVRASILFRALESLYPGGERLCAAHIRALENLCLTTYGEGQVTLPGDIRARRIHDTLFIPADDAPSGQKGIIPVDIPEDDEEHTIVLDEGKILHIRVDTDAPVSCMVTLRYDKIKGGMCIRTRREGDRLCISRDGTQHKSLNSLFTDRKVPQGKRDSMPLLAGKDENRILWIPELKRADASYNAEGTGEHRVTLWIT